MCNPLVHFIFIFTLTSLPFFSHWQPSPEGGGQILSFSEQSSSNPLPLVWLITKMFRFPVIPVITELGNALNWAWMSGSIWKAPELPVCVTAASPLLNDVLLLPHAFLFVHVGGRGVRRVLSGSLTSLTRRAYGLDKRSTCWEIYVTALAPSRGENTRAIPSTHATLINTRHHKKQKRRTKEMRCSKRLVRAVLSWSLLRGDRGTYHGVTDEGAELKCLLLTGYAVTTLHSSSHWWASDSNDSPPLMCVGVKNKDQLHCFST